MKKAMSSLTAKLAALLLAFGCAGGAWGADVAKIGDTPYETIGQAFTAAQSGDTITLLADVAPVLTSQHAITSASVIDLNGRTMTLAEDDLYWGSTTFKNGNIVVDPSVSASTAVFWMFAGQTLTFDNVKLTATGVSGTYLIGLEGENSNLNVINGSQIIVDNASAVSLTSVIAANGTNDKIAIEDSTANVKNVGTFILFGDTTISGTSNVALENIAKRGIYVQAGQSLSVEDTATVTVSGTNPRDGGIYVADNTSKYLVADTATVTSTVTLPEGYDPYVALYGTKVADGFYQNAATYAASTDFYITSKAGLEYFRDLVNQVGTVADTYVATYVNSSWTTANWYTGGIFSGKTVHLMDDVDLGNAEWSPIGQPKNTNGDKRYFYGNFNGENHTISNLKATSYTEATKTWNPGLFGYIAGAQTFSNLTIHNVTLVGYDYAGAFVGNAGSNATAFNNCHVTGDIDIKCMMTGAFVGGIVGIGTSAIDDCSVEGNSGSTIQGSTVGGLAGTSTRTAIENANTVSGSTVTGVTIQSDDANGQAGGLVGKATNPVTVTGNTVHDVTVKAENGDADALVSAGTTTASNNTTDTNVTIIEYVVAQIGETKYKTLAEAVAAAQAGDTIQATKAGTYTLPALPKNITIEGTVEGVVFNCVGAYGTSICKVSNGATFKNVSFTFGNKNYHGWQEQGGVLAFENCAFNGKFFSYGNMTFTDCAFYQSNSDYHMWVYGPSTVEYTRCAFTNDVTGKFLNIYREGSEPNVVKVSACTFINNGTASKAALNVKSTCGNTPLTADVIVDVKDCSTEGAFPTAETSDATGFIDAFIQIDDEKENVSDKVAVAEGTNIVLDENNKITGGIYKVIDTALIASGYAAVPNEDQDTSNNYPLTIGGPYIATVSDSNGVVKGGYSSFAAALAAVQDGETITVLDATGNESGTELTFDRQGDIAFTITGTAPNYRLPIITFADKDGSGGKITVTIKDATLSMDEIDARQNATVNVVDSFIDGKGGNTIVKSYFNGAINISGTSKVYTMQVTTMGYITISDSATLTATWQANVYGNGLISVNPGATFNTAALNLTGQAYSGRDNTDADRVGKPAAVIVDGATLNVGVNAYSSSGADYNYNSTTYGINVGTVDGKSAILDIKNDSTVVLAQGSGSGKFGGKVSFGAGATVNVTDGSSLTVQDRGTAGVTLTNQGTVALDAGSSVTAPEFVSEDGKVTVDMANFDGTLPLTVVTTTGGEAVLGDFEVYNMSDTKIVVDTNGDLSVVAKVYVAQLGNDGQKFETLAEAAAAASSGDTITLLADCNDKLYIVPNGVNLESGDYAYTAFFGSGTEADPFRIYNLATLQAFRNSVNAGTDYAGIYLELGADIDVSSEANWTPIGDGKRDGNSYAGNAFKGVFDGAGHKISGLTATGGSSGDSVGLFGVIDGATVKNLVFEGVAINTASKNVGACVALAVNGSTISNVTVSGEVSAPDGVGGVVGRMTISGAISSCTNHATVTATSTGAGGIVSKAYYSGTGVSMEITGCYNDGTVSAGYAAGGIAALSSANVKDCVNVADISGSMTMAGGIVAEAVHYGTLSGNVNTGDITLTGGAAAGGIVGWIRYSNSLTDYPRTETVVVTQNSNSGTISGAAATLGVGGIVGTIYNQATVTANTNTAASVTGGVFAGGIVGGPQVGQGGQSLEGEIITISGNVTYTTRANVTASGLCSGVVAYQNDTSATKIVISDNLYPVASTTVDADTVIYFSLQDALASKAETVTLLIDTDEQQAVAQAVTIAKGGYTAANISADIGYEETETAEAYVFAVEAGKVARNIEKNKAYASLADAFAEATAGETVQLLVDQANLGTVAIPANVILDGNGQKLSGDVSITLDAAGGTVKNIDFSNVQPERGQIASVITATPAEDAEFVITGNTFNTPGAVKQILIEAADATDFTATISGNAFNAGSKTKRAFAVVNAADAVKLKLDGNFIADGLFFGASADGANVSEKAYPQLATADAATAEKGIQAVVIKKDATDGKPAIFGYDTLVDAVADSASGDTLLLNDNVALDAAVATEKTLTIDGKGKTVTASDAWSIKGVSTTVNGVTTTGNITLQNVTLALADGDYATARLGGNVTLGANVTIDASAVTAEGALFGTGVTVAADATPTLKVGDSVAAGQTLISSLTLGENASVGVTGLPTGLYDAVADNALALRTQEAKVTVGETVTYYNTLQEALNAAVTATSEPLVEALVDEIDATGWSTAVFGSASKLITFDGHDVTIKNLDAPLFNKSGSGAKGVVVKNVTVKNANIQSTSDYAAVFVPYADSTGTLTFENCNIVDSNVTGNKYVGGFVGFNSGYNVLSDGPLFNNVTIKDCDVTGSTFTSNKGSVGSLMGHAAANAWSKVDITGTAVSNNTVVCNSTDSGSENYKAGAVVGTVGAAGFESNGKTGGVFVEANVGKNNVSQNGTPTDSIFGRIGSSGGMVTVTGGTYDGTADYANGSYDSAEKQKIVISGGTFQTQPSQDAIADGYVAELSQDVNGWWTVGGPFVAKIGNVGYATLADAVAAAVDGDTVELLADAEIASTITKDAAISFTIDGAGYTVSPATGFSGTSAFMLGNTSSTALGAPNYTITNTVFSGFSTSHGVLRCQGSTVTVTGCTFTGNTATGDWGIINSNYAAVTVDGCVFENNVAANSIIDVGNMMGDDGTATGPETVVRNSLFTGNTGSTALVNVGIGGGKTTLESNTFSQNTGGIAVVYAANSIDIQGNLFDRNTVTVSNAKGNTVTVLVGPYSYTGERTVNVKDNAFVDNVNAYNNSINVYLEDYSSSGTTTSYNIGGNYWTDGEAPVAGTDYVAEGAVTIETYATAYTANAEGYGVGVTESEDVVAQIVRNDAVVGYYWTLASAIAAAQDGDTVEILAETVSEGSIKFPATLKNVTIKAADGVTPALKDMTLTSADGSAVDYEGITIDGLVFDNSTLLFTGQRTGEVVYKDWTIANCTFTNVVSGTTAAVHFGSFKAGETMDGLTFTNNVIDGVTGGSRSGLLVNRMSGDVLIAGNLITNVAWNAIQLLNAPEGSTVTITNNLLSSKAEEGVINLYGNKAGMTISENAIIGDGAGVANVAYLSTAVDVAGNCWGGGEPVLSGTQEGGLILCPSYYGSYAYDAATKELTFGDRRTAVAVLKTGDTVKGMHYSLNAAVAASTAGDTIMLLDNVTQTEPLDMTKSYTLDFDGKTVYYNTTATTTISGASTIVFKNGKLDISGAQMPGTAAGNDIFSFNADGNTLTFDNMELYGVGYGGYSVFWFKGNNTTPVNTLNFANGSSIVLKDEANSSGGVFKGPGAYHDNQFFVVNITDSTVSCTNVYRFSLYGTINVKDSTVTFTGGENGFRHGIFTFDHATVTVSGANANEGKGLVPRCSDTVVTNGSVLTFIGSNIGKDIFFENANNIVIYDTSSVTAASVSGTASDRAIVAPADYVLVVTENADETTTYTVKPGYYVAQVTFAEGDAVVTNKFETETSEGGITVAQALLNATALADELLAAETNSTITVLSIPDGTLPPAGWTFVDDGTTVTLQRTVAQNITISGETVTTNATYATIQDAIDDATANDTIEVVRNVALPDGGLTIEKSLTLTGAVDDEGKPLYTVTGLSDKTSADYADIYVSEDSAAVTVAISNLKLRGFGNAAALTDGSSVVTFDAYESGSALTLDNLDIASYNQYAVATLGDGTLTVQGCAIDGAAADTRETGGVCAENGAVVVSGGEIKNVAVGIDAVDATVSVADATVTANAGGTAIGASVGATVTVDGGDYAGELDVDDYSDLEVASGHFDRYVDEAYCADGKIAVPWADKDGWYEVVSGSFVAAVISADGTVTTPYASLESAIAAAQSGETVKLLADIALADTLVIDEDVVLDVNGTALSAPSSKTPGIRVNGKVTITDGAGSGSVSVRCIDNYGELTVRDLALVENAPGTAASLIRNYGPKLEVIDSTLTVASQFGITSRTGADVVTISGTTISPASTQKGFVALNVEAPVSLTVEDSTVNAWYGVYVSKPAAAGTVVTVRDCTVNIDNALLRDDNGSAAFATFADNVTFVVENTDVTVTTYDVENAAGSYLIGSSVAGTPDRAADGLTFTMDADSTVTLVGPKSTLLTTVPAEPDLLSGDSVDLEVEGATLKAQFEAAGYGMKGVAGKDGWYTPFDPVAEIDGMFYETLQDAFDAAQDGETVTLLADVSDDAALDAEGKSVTLDLNGKTVDADVAATAGTLTLTDGSTEATGKVAGGLSAADGATLAVTGGTYDGTLSADEGGTVSVSGGLFKTPVPEDFCADGYVPGDTQDENGYYGVEQGAFVAEVITGGNVVKKTTTIAAAVSYVNAQTSGDWTVSIAAGTFTEMATVKQYNNDDRSVTIKGTKDAQGNLLTVIKATVPESSNTWSANFFIDASDSASAEALAFEDIAFDGTEREVIMSGTTETDHVFIYCQSVKGVVNRYAHNVTVKGCSFTVGDSVTVHSAMKFDYVCHLDIKDCTMTGGSTSGFLQIGKGATEISVQDCSVTGCKSGLNLQAAGAVWGGSKNLVVSNSVINVSGYGIRVDGSDYERDMAIGGCTITANQPIFLRKTTGTPASTFTVLDSTITATGSDPWFTVSGAKDPGTAPAAAATVAITTDLTDAPSIVAGKVGDTFWWPLAKAVEAASGSPLEATLVMDANAEALTIPATASLKLVKNGNMFAGTVAAADGATLNLTETADYYLWEPTVAEFIYPVAGSANGLPIPSQWLIDNSIDGYTGGALTLAVTNGLVTALTGDGANGMPMWQSYVLGLNPNSATATLRLAAGPVAGDATKVQITGNVTVVAGLDAHTTVTFRLASRNADGTWADIATGAETPSFEVSLDDVAGKVLAIFADIVTE
ncbi:MAG: right-handed parallel beta-helix repeat-containing protein [Kiritimatiellae bacterium]|nr:right-handed parallel beta-helix repeat-containing protein [Kiritimatiellia bacterium]